MSTKVSVPSDILSEHESNIQLGLQLAESSVKDNGFDQYFSKNDGFDIEDRVIKANTALLMHNANRWLKSMDESTLSLTVGGYRDFVLPIVRASFPSNALNKLVSVQPMTRKNGTVTWLNFVVDATRGNFKRGQTLFDANTGWQGRTGYTDNQIVGEAQGVAAATAGQVATLVETPVLPGSVELTIVDGAATYTLRDNGNGVLAIASVAGGGVKTLTGTNTVNYLTGAIVVTFSAALAASGAITASYTADNEGTYVKQQIGLEVQTSNLLATRRAIGMRLTLEAMQDMRAELGQEAAPTMIQAASQQIMADQAGEVMSDLWNMAGAAVATFSITVPSGVNKAEHYRDINADIQTASGTISDATQRGEATWLVVDQKAANVLLTAGAAGGFIAGPSATKGQGLVYLGTFNGLPVYKYKFLSTFPGASTYGNILVGYLGSNWFDTGYILAPYEQFYSSGPDNRADMSLRQSFAMRYAKKRISSSMFVRVDLGA